MCPRTVCTLAHIFEAAGISTLSMISIRDVAERMKPPRALYCEFPLGLPIGRPRDPTFQHRVLEAAFALLERPAGPVLEDFPETIDDEGGEPLSCPLPPRHDPNLHPAIDEAKALRSAYDRAVAKTGRTSVGRGISADEIPDEIGKFVRIAEGEPWDQVGLKSMPVFIAQNLRSYYEEIACELAEGPIGSWAVQRWFYEQSEGGKVLLSARRKMRKSGVPYSVWFHMTPDTRDASGMTKERSRRRRHG